MCRRLWMVFALLVRAWTQETHTRIQHGGASFEWGWRLEQDEHNAAPTGHYYLRLPQNSHQHYQQNSNDTTQLSSHRLENAQQPVNLLQQRYPSTEQKQNIQIITNTEPTLYQYSTVTNHYVDNNTPISHYNVRTEHPIHQNNYNYKSNPNEENIEKAESSNPFKKETNKEHDIASATVQVFKDHNCTDSGNNSPKNNDNDYPSSIHKSNVFSEIPNYEIHEINRHLSEQYDTPVRPLTYKGAVHFRVEPLSNSNARSERYYYTTEIIPVTTVRATFTEDEGISRLVASTQDLISNEDLLKINHAAEQHVNLHNDDIIKPRPRYSLRNENIQVNTYVEATTPRSKTIVNTKIGNIINSEIEHVENNYKNENNLQTSPNDYRFASPIIVQDLNYNNYKEQILNNIVSTMVPYLQDGYEIVGVKNSINEYNHTNTSNEKINEGYINVTPRPIPQKYLAPITVALRLLNANDTETLNSVEDHEVSDSEQIESTVQKPTEEKTIVEIHHSIPVDITHINDVEVHEYLEEGRSNNKGPLDYAKTLYNNYIQYMNYKNKVSSYNTKNIDYDEKNNDYNDSKENLESSENMQTEVQVKPQEDASGERNEFVPDYYDYSSEKQKIIQPIIIEKEVPVTKFVDRFIEKQVPYPEPVEVLKAVPVDRPVPFPVPYEKIVEKPVEVTRYIDKLYPIEVPQPYPVEVRVPYPVEQKVYVDRPVHIPYPVEKVVEKQILHPVAVPSPVGIPIEVPVEQKVLLPVPIETPVPVPYEVEKPVPVEKIVHKEVPVPYPVEKKVPYPVPYETKVPVPYPVEKRIPVPVEKIVEKPVTVTKIVEKPVHIEVPVPQPVPVAVHVPRPYPVNRIVEKKVPYPVHVDRIVEKKIPVQIPYPVEKIVEKIVNRPIFVTKYIDKPYTVERKVPYPVEKIVEKKVPYPVQVPFEVKVPYPVEKIVERPIHVPIKVPYPVEKIVERPVAIYYGYGHGYQSQQTSQSQNIPQYQKYTESVKNTQLNQLQKNLQNQQQLYAAQYYQYMRDLNENQQKVNSAQPTNWGNLYASSYQYINHTGSKKHEEFKKSPQLTNYINYVTNSQRDNQYYGPPPTQSSNESWNPDTSKVKRKDRTPKVMNLRIEYGGFKPPLIPSTEVDLDGNPVSKDDAS